MLLCMDVRHTVRERAQVRVCVFWYLVVVIGCAASVQAGQQPLGLLLHASGGGHGQQQGGQLQRCCLVLLLETRTTTILV